jgi:hypothetical protein
VVIATSLVVWGSSLFLSQLGPKKVDFQYPESSDHSEKVPALLEESYQQMSAEELKNISVGLETEAQAIRDRGDYEAAALKYERAYELQKDINQNHPLSPQNNPSRAVRLQLEAKNVVAEPVFLNSLDLEQRADSLAESGDLNSAVGLLDQAILAQQQINREYRDSRHDSAFRLMQLKSKLAEFESRELHFAIETAFERAISLKEAGAMKDAGERFQEAALLQGQLNEDFPDSPYFSLSRVSNFKQQSQIAQSALHVEAIKERSALLEKLLAMRKTDNAKQLLVELEQKLEVFEETFPLSSLADETLSAKLEYLNRKRSDLATIQNQVYTALLPVPGTENIYMLRTEVPQSLYKLLIGENPSRNHSESSPVDSVSWVEARTFCERLCWVLGKEVRLPTEEEFRKVLGDFAPSDASGFIWSALDAKGIPQSVGSKKPFLGGYFDLLGNVSEWLASEGLEDSDAALHIGGHVQDRLETVLDVPVCNLQKIGRSRLTGFRFVVLD